MKSFLGENALNCEGYCGLICANAVLSMRNPVPGVPKTTPRLELLLKNPAGKVSTLVRAAATPSQLTSRRPLSAGAEFGALREPPRAARKAARVSPTAALSPCDVNRSYAGGGGVGVGEVLSLHAARAAAASRETRIRFIPKLRRDGTRMSERRGS